MRTGEMIQNLFTTNGILLRWRSHDQHQQQPQRISGDVPLSTLGLLSRIPGMVETVSSRQESSERYRLVHT